MRVAGYIRVSTDGQCGEDKFGLQVQVETIEKYCSENGHEIVRWYKDEGESGAKERAGFDEIVYSEVENIEAVIVAKSDRVARDINIYFYYKMLLLKKDIKLISIAEDFEAFGVFAPMLEAFTLCVADMERQNINKRTTSGRKAKAKQGGYSGGRTPLGYVAKGNELVIVPEEAEIVRKIYRLRDRGYTNGAIAEELNEQEYHTRRGGKFQSSSVKWILDNERTYRGEYHYSDGEWVQGRHQAILSA